jgi:hypothetical protein
MSRWKFQLIVLLPFGFIMASANAGHIYHASRIWAVQGPGGFYGLVEFQADPVSVQGDTIYETAVGFGPIRFALPCRAPLAGCYLTALGFAGWLLYSLVGRLRRHDTSQSQSA